MADTRNNQYSAALIGTGRIGFSLGFDKKREQPAAHTAALNKNKRIKLIAGCDTDNSALSEWKKHNPQAAAYRSCDELFANEKPDILVIAVNESAHFSVAAQSIRTAPKLIILEKPVALNMNDGLKIREEAKRFNVPILINHERRFARDYDIAREWTAKIGAVQHITAALHSGLCVYDSAETQTGAYGLLHDGTHLIDCVLYLTEPLRALRAEQAKGKNKDADAFARSQNGDLYPRVQPALRNPIITGVYADEKKKIRGLHAHYETSFCPEITFIFSGRSKYFGFDISVYGAEGCVKIGNGYAAVFTRKESSLYSGFYSLAKQKDARFPRKTGYFARMTQNAVDFLDGRASIKSTLENGLETLAIIEEIAGFL